MALRRLLLLLSIVFALVVGGFFGRQAHEPPQVEPPAASEATGEAGETGATGAGGPLESGRATLRGNEVALAALPVEARRTFALVRAGGPFPHAKDGTTFFNRERLLPARPRGHYSEYTVPTPGADDRGARRIVAGGDPRRSDEFWYTEDHYRSFRRIRE